MFEGKKLAKEIKPIFEENFYNLERDQKYQMIFKKSLELVDFVNKYKIEHLITPNDLGLKKKFFLYKMKKVFTNGQFYLIE